MLLTRWAEASSTRVGRSRTRGQRLHCFGSLYCSQPAVAAESNYFTTYMQPINQTILLCAALLFGTGILNPEEPSKKAGKMRLTAGIDF
jgi:hypothetical protein